MGPSHPRLGGTAEGGCPPFRVAPFADHWGFRAGGWPLCWGPHPWAGGPAMRILMVTSFPIPGEYDGTAMLPIKILRALKARGVEVVLAHLRARPPWGAASRGDFEGTPSWTLPPGAWVT